ncbi:MAG TPA: hypothetical protein VFX98_03325 [Longimicrobiaceae bacterium]|nr:hypothetical protein [Longimicrobiaceae bacterium]
MIELRNDALVFSFPEVHPDAVLRVEFQRTLRIPSDGRTYPLPPGRGPFPLRHVDDFAERVPAGWLRHGGVMLPMYQAEALWISFRSPTGYPFAVKVAAGKIDAVTGKEWSEGLSQRPQNYLVHPGQPWLDGYVVEAGKIRQFVAMPLGAGYSAEEQLTGKGEFGGLQLQVFPLRRELYRPLPPPPAPDMMYAAAATARPPAAARAAPDMALGMGGSMQQEVYRDRRSPEDWDTAHTSRCFVHLANSMVWRQITGQDPPTVPPTAREYTAAGLPWFDYYAHDQEALAGSDALKGLKTIAELAKEKGHPALPENEPVDPTNLVKLHAKVAPGQVREGVF